MNIRSFLLGSALALSAKALLVIPEVEGDAIAPQGEFTTDIHPVEAYTAQQQQVNLACTECPFRHVDEDGKVSWTDGFQTSLSLTFAIEDGSLLANGRQIFPPSPPPVITAVQRRESDGEESEPIPLGYAVEISHLPTPSDDSGMDLVAVRFTVLDLDYHPVPLDTVAMTLIHDPKGNIYIAKTDLEDTAPNRITWKQCHGKAKCLRKLLLNRIHALLQAAKERVFGIKPRPTPGCGDKPPHDRPPHGKPPHGRPPHGRPHDGPHDGPHKEPSGPGRFPFPHAEGAGHRGPHSHHHMHHGGWGRTASRVVHFIVVPAALGVLAGLAASALGMLVGQVVVFLWKRYRRSSPKTNEEQGTVSEKQGLITETSDDLPPAYSDEGSLEEGTTIKN